MHQADLLFLPHDKLPRGKKVYKYALTVVDVASRYKAAEALASKDSDEVARGLAKIYKKGPLKWPQLLQVDPGREFMGAVTKAMENNKTTIRRGRPNIHRDQAIVERFNRTLAERLFGCQYAVEMNMPSGKGSSHHKHMCDTYTTLANWRVAGSALLIQSGHSRSTPFRRLSPNPRNPWCTTCLTGPSGGLFARS